MCHVGIGDIGRMTPYQLDACWHWVYPKGAQATSGKVVVPS